MKIKDEVLEPFCIKVDEHNYTLCIEKEYEKPNGEKYYVDQKASHFSSLENLLKYAPRVICSEKDIIVNLKEYINLHKKITLKIENVFKNL